MIIFVPYTTVSGATDRVAIDMDGKRRWPVAPDIMRLGKQRWGLTADAIKYTGRYIIRYRKGYQWDGASVPTPLQAYERPSSHLKESLGHDQGYQYHWIEVLDIERNEWVRLRVPKSWVDEEFRLDLDLAGGRVTKSWTIWLHVHVYGWRPWLTRTCNGRHITCPDNAGAWCPYRHDLPPMSNKIIGDDIADDD